MEVSMGWVRTAGFFFALALAAALWSQAAKGGIAGFVKDPTGAVVPGARVTAVDEQTGETVTVTSQPDGAFLIPQLSPATYRLSGEKEGFKHLVINHLKVNVDTTTTQDLVLSVGAVSESVEVVGQTSLVETTNGSVGTTVQINHVLEMP